MLAVRAMAFTAQGHGYCHSKNAINPIRIIASITEVIKQSTSLLRMVEEPLQQQRYQDYGQDAGDVSVDVS